MVTWKATIKERGNANILTPSYTFSEDLYEQNEELTRKFLIKFWGLEQPDVEWYELKKINDIKDI